MDATLSEVLNMLFRWIHVVAGVLWIGHLYFFNFVNIPLAATYDADSKKKVIPELMPRTLYWFRWGAAFTWLTGFLLLGMVYYMGGGMDVSQSGLSTGAATGVGVGALVVAWAVYDMLWKSPLGKNEMLGTAISFALIVGAAFGLSMLLGGRAAFIHVGAMFGTIMAANVWMRIWPAQRKIITAIKGGTAPDAAVAGLAKLRSKHNTFMSVPLLYTMVSSHNPTVFGSTMNWAILAGIIVVAWISVSWLYKKSTSPATTQF